MMQEAVNAFEARYQRYQDDMVDLKQRTSHVRVASTYFSQRRPFADDPLHAQALSDLTALASDVTASIDDDPAAQAALARVTHLVLAPKKMDQPEYWPLVSLEGLAKPWLTGLVPTDLKALYDEYRRANPRSQSLPNQREIRKEFERILKG